MLLALLLHIYQPPTQYPKILKAITEKSYSEIVRLLKNYPKAKLTLNIPASLIEQLEEHGFDGLLVDLANLVKRGQVELTGSAAYHPLLFRLPEAEIVRQIKLNEEINRRFFGSLWAPKGFFPPEMAVDERALRVIEACGYEWVVLEEVQSSHLRRGFGGQAPFEFQSENRRVFLREGGKLKILFRDKELSLGVAFGKIKTVGEIITDVRDNQSSIRDHLLLALDGETFGWHRPKQLGFLEELLGGTAGETSEVSEDLTSEVKEAGSAKLVTVSELIDLFPVGSEVRLGKTSWGERVTRNSQFFYPHWEDPDNRIHRMQWELTDLAIQSVRNSKYNVGADRVPARSGSPQGRTPTTPQKQWLKARNLLDRGLHSDQYFWAEGKDVWHLGMVERGAGMLRDVVLLVPDVSGKNCQKAKELYDRIVGVGKKLHGEEVRDGG